MQLPRSHDVRTTIMFLMRPTTGKTVQFAKDTEQSSLQRHTIRTFTHAEVKQTMRYIIGSQSRTRTGTRRQFCVVQFLSSGLGGAATDMNEFSALSYPFCRTDTKIVIIIVNLVTNRKCNMGPLLNSGYKAQMCRCTLVFDLFLRLN